MARPMQKQKLIPFGLIVFAGCLVAPAASANIPSLATIASEGHFAGSELPLFRGSRFNPLSPWDLNFESSMHVADFTGFDSRFSAIGLTLTYAHDDHPDVRETTTTLGDQLDGTNQDRTSFASRWAFALGIRGRSAFATLEDEDPATDFTSSASFGQIVFGVSHQMRVGRRYTTSGGVKNEGMSFEPWISIALDYGEIDYEIDPAGASNLQQRDQTLLYVTPRFGFNAAYHYGGNLGWQIGGHIGVPVLVSDDLEDEFGADVTTDLDASVLHWGAYLDLLIEPSWDIGLDIRIGLDAQSLHFMGDDEIGVGVHTAIRIVF